MHIWRWGNWASLQFISFPEVTQLVKWRRQDEWKEIRFQRLTLQLIWITAPRKLLLRTSSVFILSPQLNYKLVYGQDRDFCAFWNLLSQHTVDKDAVLPLTGLSLNHHFSDIEQQGLYSGGFLSLCSCVLHFSPFFPWILTSSLAGYSANHHSSEASDALMETLLLSLCPSALFDFWCPQTLATTGRPFAMPGLHNAPKSTFQAHKSQRILHTEF